MKKLILFTAAALLILPAQAADEEALQLAREVIEASKAVDPEGQKQMHEQSEKAFEAAIPDSKLLDGLSEEHQAEAKKMTAAARTENWEHQKAYMNLKKEKLPAIYAKVYTLEELKAMKAFYESPVGRSIVVKRNQVELEMLPFVVEHTREWLEARDKKEQESKEAENKEAKE